MQTFDKQTIDSTGAFLNGELERLDPTLHEPLVNFTWSRDIDLREDVSMADDASSFSNTNFASLGGIAGNGKAWAGKRSDTMPGMQVDITKTPNPMTLWGMELDWTIVELMAAIQVGRPIDAQKLSGLQMKLNMDIDEQVYIGDIGLGVTGLLNNKNVSRANAPSGNWGISTKTKQKLDDINEVINRGWKESGYAVCPDSLLLSPEKFSSLCEPITEAGSESILEYVSKKCISNNINGRPLNIKPLKWSADAGEGGTSRMMAYTKNPNYVRFPMVPLQRTPVEFRGLYQLTTYYGRLGVVEFVYPETVAYSDGI